MVASTRTGHALPNIDFVQTLCMSGDMPTGQIFFHDFDAIFRNTTKPTVVNILERPFTQQLLGIAAAASGGEEALAPEAQRAGHRHAHYAAQVRRHERRHPGCGEAGIPVLFSPGPLMGATGPATVAGTVALTMAEVLFGVVLVQAIQPGAPVVLKPDVDVFDMSTTQCTYSSPEQNLGKCRGPDSRHYNFPIYGLGGGVEAKVPDAEAAAIAMMSMLMMGMAGMNLCRAWGRCPSGSVRVGRDGRHLRRNGSDDPACALRHRLQRRDAGARRHPPGRSSGGSFLAADHTVGHFRKELFFPLLFRRKTMDQWLDAGPQMRHEVPHRVEEILAEAGPVPLPAWVDVALEQALRYALAETDRLAGRK